MNGKSESLKTNEQIIDELTKDLESSCIKVDDGKSASNDNDNNAESAVKSSGSVDGVCELVTEGNDNDAKYRTTDKLDKPDTNVSKDFLDEDWLKDREVTLSESEKQLLKEEAEKFKNRGNDCFKSGDYAEAISIYTQGLQTCPLAYDKERSILYANRAAARSKCLEKESAISDCTKAIELNPSYAKAYVRRGQLYQETDKLDEALEDFKKVLTFDPTHTEANYAIRRLPPLIEERNEKLKAEMLGKLKDLGNMVLKPFGLSTNNFELQKDPNSGGYSVKFHQDRS